MPKPLVQSSKEFVVMAAGDVDPAGLAFVKQPAGAYLRSSTMYGYTDRGLQQDKLSFVSGELPSRKSAQSKISAARTARRISAGSSKRLETSMSTPSVSGRRSARRMLPVGILIW